jgi:polar amino acid transport system substrate-binding protein
MRGLAAAATAALLAAAFAAWSLAAPSNEARTGAASATAAKPNLPALPSAVKSRGTWKIGVKCDTPPFGYIKDNKNGGFDVDVAHRFAQLAFGNRSKVELTCTTTQSRIPTLTSNRVDIIISTLTWTSARTQVIDFSVPYYSAGGRLMVPNNSSISSTKDLAGKTVVTTRGALYATWMRNCFKSSTLLEVDGTAAAVTAVKEGRADTFMFDDAFLLGVATLDPTLKLTNDKFLTVPWGIGIRKGDTAMNKWVNTAIKYMQNRDEFAAILKDNAPKRYWSSFLGNVPRKGTNFQYPVGKDPTSECPS